jgi:beta-aspartyl-peptidase (threonine type)
MEPEMSLIRVAIHGGAGELPAGQDCHDHRAVLRAVLADAQARLRRGETAVAVAEAAVTALEDCPLFNAGHGAVLNADGLPELDAAIMDGRDRRCGAVAGVRRLRNPVQVARRVMERSPHVLLVAEGAERFAQAQGIAWIDPQTLITDERRRQLEAARRKGVIALDHDRGEDAGFGTVGAVIRDGHGHLAAATSTGGLTNKLPGRIGDAAIIGAGTYADDRSLAVSCTGTGEAFIRCGFGHWVHARMIRGETTLAQACAEGLAELAAFGGRGGCIAIDRDGRIALPFNSNAMFRGCIDADGIIRVAVYSGETEA